MKLRQHRRRTLTAMLWRKPILVHWSEVGSAASFTFNTGFKFMNLSPRTECVIQVRTASGDRSEWYQAQMVKLREDVQRVCGMTAEMRQQPSRNSSQWEQAVKRQAAMQRGRP